MPAVPRVTVILNAASGHHDAQHAASEIQAGFDQAGCACRLILVQGVDEVKRQALKAVEAAGERGALHDLIADRRFAYAGGLAAAAAAGGAIAFAARSRWRVGLAG